MAAAPSRRRVRVIYAGFIGLCLCAPRPVQAVAPTHAPLGALDMLPDNTPQNASQNVRAVAPSMQEPAPLFPTPVALMRAVDFWTDLFLHQDSNHAILHDRDNLHIVWQIVTLTPDADGRLTDHDATRQMREATDALRARLTRLETAATSIDDEDAKLLSVWRASGQQNLFVGAASRLRSQRGVSDQFSAGMLRAKLLLPGIRQVLREEGVPEEVAVLPFVETMYNPKARSSVGALGLWQLMPGTARGFGLKVSRRRDDRADVLRATRAAARILKANYQMLGSWPLAITAYNHGCNGLRRAVALVGSSDLAYLIQNYQRSTWGFVSKNFYAEFLAVLHIMSDMPTPSYQANRQVTQALADEPAPKLQ